MNEPGGPTPEPADHLLDLLAGKHRAQALSTAAALGVADSLAASGPQTSAALADELDCDADDLRSLLQLLAGLGYLSEPDPDHFDLTERGRMLCRDALGPLAEWAGAPEQWAPWARLRDAIRRRDGLHKTAFELATGKGLYEFLAEDAEAAARYDMAIETFTRHEADTLRDKLDLTTAQRVVDVGGGRGTVLFALLRRWPHLHGVLFDLPHVIDAATKPTEPALAERVEFARGDFFREVPADGDVYLLKHVLHNWDDERAGQLLRRCVEVMAPGGRVIVIDALLAPDNRTDLARLLDLEMRVLTGGRERRKPELRRLFAAVGLGLERAEPLTASSWLLIGRRKND